MPDFEWPPDATAYFDQYGILNADCATDEDCAMVLGYYHAADRFVQMDFRRRFPTGRLTEIVDRDFAYLLEIRAPAAESRALFSTREGRPLEDFVLEQASAKTIALLEAYSAGVNQWIDDVQNGRNDAVFPREFADPPFAYGPADIPQWTPSDSFAAVLLIVERSTSREGFEVSAGAARDVIKDDLRFSDLWALRPRVESSILPPGWTPPESSSSGAAAIEKQQPRRDGVNAGPALRRLEVRLKRIQEIQRSILGADLAGGSNNWVIAPSRSMTGNALLANDPHQPMGQPAMFYLAHLDAKTSGTGTIHAAGATTPGIPWVVVGQNENIAWGVTDTFLDMTDVYVEELVKDGGGNAMGVMFKGEVVLFTRVPFTVRYSDGTSEEHELLFVPHHGPVREIDLDNGVAITLRWTGHDMDTDVEVLTPLSTATTVMEARAAVENVTTLGWNLVAADIDGNIGWFPYNRIPKRTWATNLSGDAPPWLPLDGRCVTPERCYEWTEYFDYAELPQALNPSEGFIATANNDMTGALFDGDPTNDGYAPFQTHVVPGIRHARIVGLIEGIGSEHTTATMQRIQHDVHSLQGALQTPGFLAIAESDMTTLSERAQKIVNALKAWESFVCPTGLKGPYVDSELTDDPDVLREASGCAAFHAALYNCAPLGLRKDYVQPAPVAYFDSIVDPSRLVVGDVYWDDPDTPEIETTYQTIGECFDVAGRLLATDLGLGDDETKWAWGRAHRLTLNSDLSALGISTYNNRPPGQTPFTNDGGWVTVSPTNPGLDASGFFQAIGAATRLVCEALPTGPSCTIELPGGQSGHITSDNYDDLLFKYLDGEPIDLVFDIDEAKANAVRTVTFE